MSNGVRNWRFQVRNDVGWQTANINPRARIRGVPVSASLSRVRLQTCASCVMFCYVLWTPRKRTSFENSTERNTVHNTVHISTRARKTLKIKGFVLVYVTLVFYVSFSIVRFILQMFLFAGRWKRSRSAKTPIRNGTWNCRTKGTFFVDYRVRVLCSRGYLLRWKRRWTISGVLIFTLLFNMRSVLLWCSMNTSVDSVCTRFCIPCCLQYCLWNGQRFFLSGKATSRGFYAFGTTDPDLLNELLARWQVHTYLHT